MAATMYSWGQTGPSKMTYEQWGLFTSSYPYTSSEPDTGPTIMAADRTPITLKSSSSSGPFLSTLTSRLTYYTCGLIGWGGKAIRQAPWASGDGCLRDSSQGPEAPPSLPTVEALCGFSTGCLQFTQDGSPTAVGEDAKELLACFPEIVCSS